MAGMARVTVNWTGFVGAPGYTNLYFRDFDGGGAITQEIANGAVAKTDVWLDTWVASLPSSVSILVDPTVEVIEETTGALTGFFTTSPDTARTGASTGAYSAVAGACVNWYTDNVRNGRRMRGRSFIVPLGSAGLATNGTLDDAKLVTWRTATATFIDGVGVGDLGVWGRPSAPGATDGVWSVVKSFSIPDKTAYLSSRRD